MLSRKKLYGKTPRQWMLDGAVSYMRHLHLSEGQEFDKLLDVQKALEGSMSSRDANTVGGQVWNAYLNMDDGQVERLLKEARREYRKVVRYRSKWY